MRVDQGREAGKGGWVERGRVRAGDRGMEGDRDGGGWKVEGACRWW